MNKEEILKNMKKMEIEFYKIQSKNWILNKSNGTGSAGRTLEILLGKAADNAILPDYLGIEIKTQMIHTHYRMSLFSMAFDNKPLEMQRLLRICGYPDRVHPEIKVFQVSVSGNRLKKLGFRACKLYVDYPSQVVRLLIFEFGKIVDKSMSWSFDELKSRLEHKLKYLAFIPCKKWVINEKCYFKYLSLTFYQLKTFDIFLRLIEQGIITVVFKLGYYKSGENFGQLYDHGTTFEIDSSNLLNLFEPIFLNQGV